MAWSHIATGDVDDDSPLTESVFADVKVNQDELLVAPINIAFGEQSHSESDWTDLVTSQIYLPKMLTIAPNHTYQLILTYARKMSAGSSDYYVRSRFNGSSWDEKGPFTNTSYVIETLTFNDAAVRAAALQETVLFEIEGKIASIYLVQVRNQYGLDGISRLELI
jgi:hypothetical protein